MASGETHEHVSKVTCATFGSVTSLATLFFLPDIEMNGILYPSIYPAILVALFWMLVHASTLWLSPDLDGEYSKSLTRWKQIGFDWYWYPYKKLIKHRSVCSHGGIISSAIKFVYVFPFLVLPVAFASFAPDFSLEVAGLTFLLFYLAIATADMLHIAVDSL